MKRLSFSQALASFCLIFLILASLTASAARLEVDRAELMVGEITSVHLKGAPFIAVVDWKVGPELEIVESDSKRALVKAKRVGTGTITCEMNLKTYTLSIAVRGNAAATLPAAPMTAPVQTPPPAYTTPAYTPPSYSTPAPTAASQPANLAGTWQINAAGYQGKLELSSTQGMLIGRVWFDAHAIWEPLEDLYFDEAIRELSFTRPGASQSYRGRLQGNTLDGMFTQWGGRDYSANAPSYPWSATRSGVSATPVAATAAMPAMRPARIAELTWQGMNEDKVGDLGNGRPNGTPDGHLRLTLDLPDRQTISSISLWSANEKGDKAGGQIWHSKNASYWMLGVFRDGRQLNAAHVASLGEFSGSTVFDLYANSSGWFNPGQTFLVEVESSDGKVTRQTLLIGAVPPPSPAAMGGNQRLKLVDAIPSTPSDVFRRNQRTDLTMHTSGWDRTPYFMATPRTFDLNLARIERACLAGDAKGGSGWNIDNYILFELFDSSGTPLGAAVVGDHEGVSQNGHRLPELANGHNYAPCAVDLKNFLPTGRPFRLKVSAMDYGGVGNVSDLWLLLDESAATMSIPANTAVAGTWQINANGYTGKVEFSESGGKLGGRVWFDAHQVWEDLRDISFDGHTLRFLRPGPSQRYTGTLSGNEVRGKFDGGGNWNWVITRTGAASTPSSGATNNLARGKPASQSSRSQWSRPDDPQGAVDGIINGSYAFHTNNEANPWWQVDLGTSYRLSEVRIYNRLDSSSERARTIQVMLSDDGRNWRTVYRHNGSLFGGKDGKPLGVGLNGEIARYLRLQLNESNWFHLDEVEVMGMESTPSDGGRDYTSRAYPPSESKAPGSNDILQDSLNQLKDLFKR